MPRSTTKAGILSESSKEHDALEQLLALPVPPTAIFCHSDIMALGALSLAKRRGLKVPEDLLRFL